MSRQSRSRSQLLQLQGTFNVFVASHATEGTNFVSLVEAIDFRELRTCFFKWFADALHRYSPYSLPPVPIKRKRKKQRGILTTLECARSESLLLFLVECYILAASSFCFSVKLTSTAFTTQSRGRLNAIAA
ncbi:hypothetical protein L218DRAFT_626356 [Marasmius fiardii PR-910]|nr:hypothetical protein L218DRAFT_626356 [Marasmius fiardii PR-910]